MRDLLPEDWQQARLLGRLLLEDGPTPVLVDRGRVIDISKFAPTTAEALNRWQGEIPQGRELGSIESLQFSREWEGRASLLSPFDLQCIKASGVTFAISAVERVIEERARGDAAKAQSVRDSLRERVGADIRSVKPGSAEAERLKSALIADGLWSQYLEVAIGPYAEIFTKSPVLSTVGWGAWIGVRSDSSWNNPEPEVVLACNREGRILGAALGNDVNYATSKGVARCCSAKPRTTTRPARWVRSFACSMRTSRWTTCAAQSCVWMCWARMDSNWKARARCR